MEVVNRYPWNPFSRGVKKYIEFLEALERLKTKLGQHANECEIEDCVWEISIYDKHNPSKQVLSWGYVDYCIFSDNDFKLVKDKGERFGFIVKVTQ